MEVSSYLTAVPWVLRVLGLMRRLLGRRMAGAIVVEQADAHDYHRDFVSGDWRLEIYLEIWRYHTAVLLR